MEDRFGGSFVNADGNAQGNAIAIYQPDLSAVAGQPVKYWVVSGDVISLANQAARDAVDTAELSTRRDSLANEIDRDESFMKGFALVVLDEINALRAQHGLSQRSIAQLKNAVRNKLNG